MVISQLYQDISLVTILSHAIYQRAPRYGDMRTWVVGSQEHRNRALAEASNLLSYYCTDYTFLNKRTQLLNTNT